MLSSRTVHPQHRPAARARPAPRSTNIAWSRDVDEVFGTHMRGRQGTAPGAMPAWRRAVPPVARAAGLDLSALACLRHRPPAAVV